MDLEKLMKTTPERLAKVQADELRKHILNRLDEIKQAVESGDYSQVAALTFYSPAGDGYGSDNHPINFSYNQYPMDIREVTELLEGLEQTAKGNHDIYDTY